MDNTSALIEEIKTFFSKYDDSGLVDENSLYRDIVQGLKRFGNDICEMHETVVEVKNGKAKLPDNFFSLYIAYLCEPLGYKKDDNIVVDDLQSSFFYRERVINSSKWNECDPCCKIEEEKVIRENLYFRNNKVEFIYHKPQLLQLGRSFKRTGCHKNCRNKMVKDNPNEINISGKTLQANFEEGDIYLRYYGFPMDEEGVIQIPDTPNGHLETYLEYHLKERFSEKLIADNDAQGLSRLYPTFVEKAQMYLRNAASEVKMSNLSLRGLRRISRLNKLEALQYEIGTKWK